jgi:hypothetical protein
MKWISSKNLGRNLILFVLALAACSHTPTATPLPMPTHASTPTPVPATLAPMHAPNGSTGAATLTPIVSDQPGLVIRGYVQLANGSGVPGVEIYRAFASYSGDVVATTDQAGNYQSDFKPIPGDEMVRVWAELPGYTFEPAGKVDWLQGAYFWRHYHSFENRVLNFVAKPN